MAVSEGDLDQIVDQETQRTYYFKFILIIKYRVFAYGQDLPRQEATLG